MDMRWQAIGLAATIFIRSYNNFGVPAADLAAAREHAEAWHFLDTEAAHVRSAALERQ
jgi:hypothetical protein